MAEDAALGRLDSPDEPAVGPDQRLPHPGHRHRLVVELHLDEQAGGGLLRPGQHQVDELATELAPRVAEPAHLEASERRWILHAPHHAA